LNFWNQAPLFRLLPGFVLGIISAVYLGWMKPVVLLMLMIIPASVLSAQALFHKQLFTHRFRWVYGICTHLLVFLTGWLITELKTEINSPQHFSQCINPGRFLGYLDDGVQERNKSFKTTIHIIATCSGGRWIRASGR